MNVKPIWQIGEPEKETECKEKIYRFDLNKKEVEIITILNKYGFEEIKKINDNISNIIAKIIIEKE